MANDTGAFGLRPIRMADGTPWNGAVEKCYISSSYNVALYVGTPVLLSPTLAEKDATGEHQTVNIAVVNSGIWYGVIVGFEPNPNNLSLQYSPASTEGYCYVAKGPDVVYLIRGDGGGTLTKTVPGENAQAIATSAGSTSTGLSGWHLDEGTTTAPTTTQTLPMTILRVHQAADNTLGANALYEVRLTTQRLAAGDTLGITAA